MKRIIVIGSGGAGKSTFSKRLGDVSGIEVIHLDQIYWRPNWVKTGKDEWRRIVEGLIAKNSWIMDGNFGGTREMRLAACDTVIFLDIPRRICLYRILKRSIIYRGKTRPDMAEGCKERFDLEFLVWVWNYPKTSGKRALEEMSQLDGKRIIVLRNTNDIEEFLKNPYAKKER